MIDYLDLKTHLSELESGTKEFKPSVHAYRDDIGATLSAFANDFSWTGGGWLYIGVDNSGKPIGLTSDSDEEQKRIADICRDSINPPLAPHVRLIHIDGHDILEIKVGRSVSRPHRHKGTCYIRVASTTRKATLEEEQLIRQNAVVPSFDSQPVARLSESDIDWHAVEQFLRSTKSPDVFETSPDVREIATNLELCVKTPDKIIPKIGTVLVFGSNPTKLFPQSKIQAIRFNGIDITSPIASRQIIEGNLPQLITTARDFIENLTGKGSLYESNKLTRVDIHEYPFFVIREAIANAVVHRDYSQDGREIDVKVFDDRIEITSPGGLGGGLTIEDLGTGKRYIRNQLITDILNDLRFVERAGTGIARILKEMKINGSAEPKFKSDSNSFIAILPAHPMYGARRLVEQANQEKSRSNYPRASELFRRALDLDPNNYSALTAWAELELQLGNRENSRVLLKRAIEVDPTIPNAWLSIAFLEERLGNSDSARDIYRSATKAVPNPSVVYRSWAILEWNQKQYKLAAELFEQAIKLDPKDVMNYYKRGQMNINSPIDRVRREGEADLRKALNFTNDDYVVSDIYFLLARSMKALHYSEMEIEDAYRKAIQHNPGRAVILFTFGEFLKSIGRNEEGAELVSKAFAKGYIPKARGRRR